MRIFASVFWGFSIVLDYATQVAKIIFSRPRQRRKCETRYAVALQLNKLPFVDLKEKLMKWDDRVVGIILFNFQPL